VLTINTEQARETAIRIARKAPFGTQVTFKSRKRSLPQNSRMWSMLTEISTQLRWCNQVLPPDDWKLIFLDALKREVRCVPNLDNNGMVMLSRSSSDLTKQEMTDMMTLMEMFAAQHGVTFHDPRGEATIQPQAKTGNLSSS
jgi:hypothetical protein